MSDAAAGIQTMPDRSGNSGRGKRLLGFGIFIAAILIAVIFAVAFNTMSEARRTMEEELLQRQMTIGSTRVETTDVWLASLVEQSHRLVNSDLFQLFASEVDKIPGGVPLLFAPSDSKENEPIDEDDHLAQLTSQLPLMKTMLSEFVSYSGFSAGRIVTSRAETYMGTEASIHPLTSSQKKVVERVVSSGHFIFAPVEVHAKGLNLDIYVPIMAYHQQDGSPVAVLILSRNVDSKLAEILSPGVVGETGRKIKMVQKNDDIFQNVTPGATMLRQVTDFPLNEDGALEFELRKGIGENHDVYSSGVRIRSTDMWIVTENEAEHIQSILSDKARTTYGLASVLAVALVLLFSTVWWRLVGREQSAINTQISGLLSIVGEQKKLLDGINSTMRDPVSLTDGKGIYRYVNAAFGEAIGRTPEEVIGLDGPAVFGFDTAKRLNASDQHVLMTGESISITEVLWLQSKRFHFQISKTPLREPGSRTPQGIVSVYRDITQLVETEERSRRMVQQTIDALVRAIEESDPFLGGHSRIMGGIAALMAKQMHLPERDTATIAAAANLSQIGKMFVPRDVLLKPGALTAEEKAQMEQHVEHARSILKDIEFDLPVVSTIYQMNERLDGGGYPRGLTGDEISTEAKVLAVANAFTAMARPRSYRPALPVEEAVAVLEKQTGSYEPQVVNVLKQVLATPAGERLAKMAAASKAL